MKFTPLFKISLVDKNLLFVLRGAGTSFVAKITGSVFGMLCGIIMARNYGADITGQVSLTLSATSMASLLGLLGVNVAILKFVQKEKSAAYSILKKTIVSTTIYSAVCSLLGIVFYLISQELDYNFRSNKDIVLLVIATVWLFSILNLVVAFLRSIGDIKAYSYTLALPSIIKFLLLSIGLIYIDSYQYPLYLVFIVPAIMLIAISIYIYKKYSIYNEVSALTKRTLFRVGSAMSLSEAMYLLIANIDIIMIGAMLGSFEAGIYSMSMGFIMMLSFVISALQAFAAPKFSELYHLNRIEELGVLAQKLSKIAFSVMLLPVLILLFFSENILVILYGETFGKGRFVLMIMSVVFLYKASAGLTGMYLNMTGRQTPQLIIACISCFINFLLNYFLIPLYGIDGAAISTGSAIIFMATLSAYYIKKKDNLSIFYIPIKRVK